MCYVNLFQKARNYFSYHGKKCFDEVIYKSIYLSTNAFFLIFSERVISQYQQNIFLQKVLHKHTSYLGDWMNDFHVIDISLYMVLKQFIHTYIYAHLLFVMNFLIYPWTTKIIYGHIRIWANDYMCNKSECCTIFTFFINFITHMNYSQFGLIPWEEESLYNAFSHWLSPYSEWYKYSSWKFSVIGTFGSVIYSILYYSLYWNSSHFLRQKSLSVFYTLIF